jgi:hypothetical protein
MIMCSCRGISTNHFPNNRDLVKRIMQDDAECGCCQHDIEDLATEMLGDIINNEENKK